MAENILSNEIFDKLVSVVKNQTNYTEEISRQKLTEHNNDPIKVIREYMGISVNSQENEKKDMSLNQKMYSEIGDLIGFKKL